MKYCCDNLEHYIKKGSELEYNPVTRLYCMKLNCRDNMCTHQQIWYCPWCGSELPKYLDDIWFKVLKEEYGIKDPIFDDADKVPEEFKTDEWWKKRGL